MLTAYRSHQGELLLIKSLHFPASANKHVLSYPQDTPTRANVVQFYDGWIFNSGNYLFTTDTK